MGKTRDLFKKIRDIKGRFNAKMGSIKDRNCMEWRPTPVLLPGKSHGQRSLVGYSPWGGRESDTTDIWSLWLCHTVCGSNAINGECLFLFTCGLTSGLSALCREGRERDEH